MSKKEITNDEWNAWAGDVRTFLDQDLEEVLSATQQMMEANGEGDDFDSEELEENWEEMQAALSAGDRRAKKRQLRKNVLSNHGRGFFGWPKRQGGGKPTPLFQQVVLGEADAIFAEAFGAYWDVLSTHGADHLEMTRSSSKDGGTDGQTYGTRDNFVKARVNSKNTSLKGDIREGLWLNANDPEAFSLSSPLTRPYVAKVPKKGDSE